MKYPSIIELNGKQYMSAKTAAGIWNLKPSTVSDYCIKGKVCQAIKYLEARWYIPIDAVKPLSNDEIRRFLILTLQLKNNPSLEIDWSVFPIKDPAIDTIYRYLVFREMIEPFKIFDAKRIPYEVVLTQKGLEFATSIKKEKIEDFGTALKEWIPTIIGAAQLIAQVTQMVAA
jgi:hypothetical protein